MPLQNLLNHIAERIVLLQNEVISVCTNIPEIKLIASYGFLSLQTDFQIECMDQSLFVTTLIPPQLFG